MITLQKDIFDTLDLMAHAYGGVGAGKDFDFIDDGGNVDVPCCIHGLAYVAGNPVSFWSSNITVALRDAGVSRCRNDEAVRAINARKGANPHARVDFITEYCPELGIVRGE